MSPHTSLPRSPLRVLLGVVVLLGVALSAVAWAAPTAARAAQPDRPAGPTVDILRVTGTIDPPVVAAVRELVREADGRGSDLVLIQVDSPGGVAVDRADVEQALAGSQVPVVVWVGPGTARAVGAATYLAGAADLLALARDAQLGPACPVSATGACDPADAAALAALYGDGADLLLDDGVSARRATSVGLAALTVDDYASLLQDLDGRRVETASGARTLELPEAQLTVRLHSLGLLRRILHASLTSTFVELLLFALLLLLGFELFQPGFGVAGVAALLVAPLLVYGLVVLPVAWWALALLVLGVALLAIDLAIAGLGVPTVAGTVATTVGAWWLFPHGSPLLTVPGWVVAVLVAATVVFFALVMTVVLRAQAGPDVATDDLVGQVGVVRSTMNPEGHVFVSGGLWRARTAAGEGVRTGTAIRVTDIDGPVLVVEPTARP